LNYYFLRLSGQTKEQVMVFDYYSIPGTGGELYQFNGPGFRYVRQGEQFVAIEGPPER
jgi:hypothetical protein